MKPVIILDDVFSEGDLIELDSVGKNINESGINGISMEIQYIHTIGF